MNRREKLYAAFLAVMAVVAVVMAIGAYTVTSECKAKGGERLRPFMGPWTCYDAASLKELK